MQTLISFFYLNRQLTTSSLWILGSDDLDLVGVYLIDKVFEGTDYSYTTDSVFNEDWFKKLYIDGIAAGIPYTPSGNGESFASTLSQELPDPRDTPCNGLFWASSVIATDNLARGRDKGGRDEQARQIMPSVDFFQIPASVV